MTKIAQARDRWLTDEERQAIIALHDKFPLEGCRRLSLMMIDQDLVIASGSIGRQRAHELTHAPCHTHNTRYIT